MRLFELFKDEIFNKETIFIYNKFENNHTCRRVCVFVCLHMRVVLQELRFYADLFLFYYYRVNHKLCLNSYRKCSLNYYKRMYVSLCERVQATVHTCVILSDLYANFISLWNNKFHKTYLESEL